MTKEKIALLLPGQGGYSPGLLGRMSQMTPATDREFAHLREVVHTATGIDLVTQVDRDADAEQLSKTAPEALQFAIFAASVMAASAFRKAGPEPVCYVGHSFGEIAALVAADACSVEDGVRIIAARNSALGEIGSSAGYMMAAGIDRERAAQLLAFLGREDVAIAGRNEERQIVLSGAAAGMEQVVNALSAVQVLTNRVHSPYPFHSPVLAGAVSVFGAAIADVKWRPSVSSVYSPIAGRYYRPDDNMSAILASHLTSPFDFFTAVRTLHAEGLTRFIECGGRDTLTRVVRRVLADADGWTATAVDHGERTAAAWKELTATVDDEVVAGLRAQTRLLLGASEADFAAFWSTESARLLTHIRQTFAQTRLNISEAPSVAAAPTPAPAPAASSPAPMATTAAPDLNRDVVLAELTELYSTALEYPPEVFTEDVELEADLGVDSVKQTDLLVRVSRHYGMAVRPDELRITEFRTLSAIADKVIAEIKARAGDGAKAVAAG